MTASRPAPGGWRYFGQQRPPFAIAPGPGEESVWDYPRPPRLEALNGEVVVKAGEIVIARTRRALRVLETASPLGLRRGVMLTETPLMFPIVFYLQTGVTN